MEPEIESGGADEGVGTDSSFDATLQRAKTELASELAGDDEDDAGEPSGYEDSEDEDEYESEEGEEEGDEEENGDEDEDDADEGESEKKEEKLSPAKKRRERERKKLEARVREEVTGQFSKEIEEQRAAHEGLQAEMGEMKMSNIKAETTIETAAGIIEIYESRLQELGELDLLRDKIEIAKRDHLLKIQERTTEHGQTATRLKQEQAQSKRQREAEKKAAELRGMATAAKVDPRRFLAEIRIRAEDMQREGQTVDVSKLASETLEDMTKARRRKKRRAESRDFTPLSGKGGSRRSGNRSKVPDVGSSDFVEWGTSELLADALAEQQRG